MTVKPEIVTMLFISEESEFAQATLSTRNTNTEEFEEQIKTFNIFLQKMYRQLQPLQLPAPLQQLPRQPLQLKLLQPPPQLGRQQQQLQLLW